jgi:hypothetical protein
MTADTYRVKKAKRVGAVKFLLPCAADQTLHAHGRNAFFIVSPGTFIPLKPRVGCGRVWDKERLDLFAVKLCTRPLRLEKILKVRQSEWDKDLRESTNN